MRELEKSADLCRREEPIKICYAPSANQYSTIDGGGEDAAKKGRTSILGISTLFNQLFSRH